MSLEISNKLSSIATCELGKLRVYHHRHSHKTSHSYRGAAQTRSTVNGHPENRPSSELNTKHLTDLFLFCDV